MFLIIKSNSQAWITKIAHHNVSLTSGKYLSLETKKLLMSHCFVGIDVKCATPILMSLSWIFSIPNNSIVLKIWEPCLAIKFKSSMEFVRWGHFSGPLHFGPLATFFGFFFANAGSTAPNYPRRPLMRSSKAPPNQKNRGQVLPHPSEPSLRAWQVQRSSRVFRHFLLLELVINVALVWGSDWLRGMSGCD